jgi:hypothetical protein
MFDSFFELVFGCPHKNTTFPLTARGGIYVACLDCGKEFAYDWKAMQIGEPVATRPNTQAVPLRRPA